MNRNNASESNVYKEVQKIQVPNKFEFQLTSSQGKKGNISQNLHENTTHFSRSRIIPGNYSLVDPEF